MNRNNHVQIQAGQKTAHFSWLLVALLAALALPPLLQATQLGVPGLRLGLTAVLLAALALLGGEPRALWAGLCLAVPALVFDWTSLVLDSRGFALASSALAIAFLALVIVRLVDTLLRTNRVTTDTILGGICVYVLVGVLWVSAFTLVENLHPGSLLLDGSMLPSSSESFRHSEILYFSFVTLTTLGYGDIQPSTAAARALASGEAIVGQLYVAIFVARLVGLHLAHAQPRSRD